jgi:hypothetical protein
MLSRGSLQLFQAALPILAEAMIVADDQVMHLDGIQQDFLDELLGGFFAECLGKGDDQYLIDPDLVQSLDLFLLVLKQLNLGLRHQHFPRVGMEGEDDAFAVLLAGLLNQLTQDGSMAQMYAIVGAHRYNGLGARLKCLKGIEYLQDGSDFDSPRLRRSITKRKRN